jgi:hypothetical protein
MIVLNKVIVINATAKITATEIRTTSAYTGEPRRMLKGIQRFGKHCSCHLQGGCVMVRHLWKPHAVHWGVVEVLLVGGTEEQAEDGS